LLGLARELPVAVKRTWALTYWKLKILEPWER
jgi:hypothetical protein